jgi:hypothetical protein
VSGLLRAPSQEDAQGGIERDGSARTPEETLIEMILSGQKELFVDLIRRH